MKKLFILFVLSIVEISCIAQTRKWEHSLVAGIGVAFDKETAKSSVNDTRSALAIKAGYGLSYYLNQHVAMHTRLTYRHVGTYGLMVGYLDVPVGLRYYLDADSSPWSFGIGPVLSYCIRNDKYDLDNTSYDALVGKDIFKTFGLGLQPSITYRGGRHFELSLEGYIGLNNVKKDYEQTTRREYFHSFMATIGYVF